MNELKPCPFCGNTPKMHRDSWDTPTGKAVVYWVKCAHCGSSSNEYKTKDKATEAWNRRLTDA